MWHSVSCGVRYGALDSPPFRPPHVASGPHCVWGALSAGLSCPRSAAASLMSPPPTPQAPRAHRQRVPEQSQRAPHTNPFPVPVPTSASEVRCGCWQYPEQSVAVPVSPLLRPCSNRRCSLPTKPPSTRSQSWGLWQDGGREDVAISRTPNPGLSKKRSHFSQSTMPPKLATAVHHWEHAVRSCPAMGPSYAWGHGWGMGEMTPQSDTQLPGSCTSPYPPPRLCPSTGKWSEIDEIEAWCCFDKGVAYLLHHAPGLIRDMVYYTETQEANHTTSAAMAQSASLTQTINIMHHKPKVSHCTHGAQGSV